MADNHSIIAKLQGLEARFEEISTLITDPHVISDSKRFIRLGKEYHDLELILSKGKSYRIALDNIQEAKKTLADNSSDEELRQMSKELIDEEIPKLDKIEEEIKLLLLPKDPEDEKNSILEIRGGTGGDEAALFAGDLLKMYLKYIDSKGWSAEITSSTEGSIGGFKEVVLSVTGEGAYGTLKYEGGVHRVQRIPATETQGRIHTSAATVAVLPEVDEFDVEIKESDIRTDTYCSSGAGGQSVNTTYSAVRLVHIPTGITVQCQDQKSQIKNKAKALVELRSRIYNIEHQKYLDEISAKRKTMVSTGDRSAKIRTYNYPQGRVTDHRINFTVYNLPSVMNGDLQAFIDALTVAENVERMKEAEL